MKKAGVAILGLGVVGGGTLEILLEKKKQIADEYGVDLTVVAVLDKFKEKVLKYGLDESIVADSIDDICDNPDVDIVVECMGGLEPAKTFLTKALLAGKSIVTSNKEMFAKSWVDLEKAAAKTGAGLYYEATTGGGMPIIRVMTQAMQANSILEIKAIINGTTNYILSKMTQEGADYAEVLKDAQALGYAEANPVADVEGYDSSYKLSILSSLAFNKRLPVDLISREGITKITKTDIKIAGEMGFVIKLLAIAKRHGACQRQRFVQRRLPRRRQRRRHHAVRQGRGRASDGQRDRQRHRVLREAGKARALFGDEHEHDRGGHRGEL